jgi:hypothetical protein
MESRGIMDEITIRQRYFAVSSETTFLSDATLKQEEEILRSNQSRLPPKILTPVQNAEPSVTLPKNMREKHVSARATKRSWKLSGVTVGQRQLTEDEANQTMWSAAWK